MPKATLSNRSTIKNDPFAAVIPVQEAVADSPTQEVISTHTKAPGLWDERS